ncbi:hypothetical protein MHI24_20085 [Paenibacillus sp. FSL K6-1096]|uniref:hypothetical protein n=1 Tax=Paenibacillus sp. FSL K6-1096 TaxID=2921460 RepID=UPI0030ED7E1B
MALVHEFYLIPAVGDAEHLWMNIANNPKVMDSVVIHDDIILYINDTLKWIPSSNPALPGMPTGAGINYYGVTLFDQHSAAALHRIFSAWRDLFLNSPQVLELTGEFYTIEGEEQSGQYERLIYERHEVIEQFAKMISFADRLFEGGFYLFHCGI